MEASQPFARTALGEADLQGRGFDAELLSRRARTIRSSTARRQSSIMMHVHVWVGFAGLDVFTPFTLLLPRMNNLLKHHT